MLGRPEKVDNNVNNLILNAFVFIFYIYKEQEFTVHPKENAHNWHLVVV